MTAQLRVVLTTQVDYVASTLTASAELAKPYATIRSKNKEKLMSIRKIALLNSDNVVAAVLAFDDSDIIDQGSIAGMLSDPEVFEVSPYSKAVMGWKYINGVESNPDQPEEV
jgi:hypothetical protein